MIFFSVTRQVKSHKKKLWHEEKIRESKVWLLKKKEKWNHVVEFQIMRDDLDDMGNFCGNPRVSFQFDEFFFHATDRVNNMNPKLVITLK